MNLKKPICPRRLLQRLVRPAPRPSPDSGLCNASRSNHANDPNTYPEYVEEGVGPVFLDNRAPRQHDGVRCITQTKWNGLLGPNQLTREKLKILISTPTISMARRFRVTAAFILRNSFMLIPSGSVCASLDAWSQIIPWVLG